VRAALRVAGARLGAALAIAGGWGGEAQASWQPLPKNLHALHQSYGLLRDFQSSLLYGEGGLHWAGLGGSFALAGDPDSEARPQIVLLASLDGAIRDSDGAGPRIEALDGRLGGAVEWTLNPMMRLSVGAVYASGHSGALANEASLGSGRVSDTRAFARFTYDLGPYARVSATLAPVLRSDPGMVVFSAHQAVEIHPWSGADDLSPSPYLALGAEQEGAAAFGLRSSLHAQIGAYLGTHFNADSRPSLRLVLGYRAGPAPSTAASRLRDERASFAYAGVMLGF
jgi:hypothetical protein